MIRLNRGGIMAGLGMVGALALFIPRPGLASGGPEEVAVFSGGCFWGVEAVFEHVKGVKHAESGYAGGVAATANYEAVSTGDTGHAESVRVVFDPSEVSYAQLLQVFFSVAHDPTQLNYQGPDHGPQYRSAIWYTSEAQKRTAEAYIAQLTRAHTFRKPIVTEVKPLSGFYLAEAYHQDYATRHPDAPYIVYNDAPKVEHLKKDLPALYRSARSS
ncbi:MAG: peptide-methionine (S)-S-oxide reductase MsrA [Bacillota bacterium]|jgi:peptide-methionine (S)-S-oxide reductase